MALIVLPAPHHLAWRIFQIIRILRLPLLKVLDVLAWVMVQSQLRVLVTVLSLQQVIPTEFMMVIIQPLK